MFKLEEILLRKPTRDEFERVNCDQPGVIGHTLCGWCKAHDRPRFICACPAPRPKVKV